MGSIWVTGDMHADYDKFSHSSMRFQDLMSRDDYVIVCGDFGIWHDNKRERYCLNELDNRKFTTLFCDGNHECFDRLCTDEYNKYMAGLDITGADQGEFPLVDMFGGKVQQIRPHIFHLLRGEVYNIHGKTIFVFGGASSHDIDDGILDRADFTSDDDFYETCYLYRKQGRMFRINHESWWKEELPSADEMQHGLDNLAKHDFKVDYIITHCLPTSYSRILGFTQPDILTDYLQQVSEKTEFQRWFCGHYHCDTFLSPPEVQVLYHRFAVVYDDLSPLA